MRNGERVGSPLRGEDDLVGAEMVEDRHYCAKAESSVEKRTFYYLPSLPP